MKYKILIVDDDSNILSSLKRTFNSGNYELLLAGNAIKGLQVLSEHRPEIIISDLKMPEIDGIQFLLEVKNICPKSIRIMLSAYSDKKDVIKAIEKGEIWKYLLKPWDNDELKDLIKQAVQLYEKNNSKKKEMDGFNYRKKIFFLYPPKIIKEEIIYDIIFEGYESYNIEEHKKALNLFKKYNNSILFINIDMKIKNLNWEEYIEEFINNPATKDILTGVLSYNTNNKLMSKYLMELGIPCGFIQLKMGNAKSKDIIIKVLEANEAKGIRQSIRIPCNNDPDAVFNIKMYNRIYSGKVVDISIDAMACSLKKHPKIEINDIIDDIQLKLKGVAVQTSGVVKIVRKQNNDYLFIIMFNPEDVASNKKKLTRFIHYSLQEKINEEIMRLQE